MENLVLNVGRTKITIIITLASVIISVVMTMAIINIVGRGDKQIGLSIAILAPLVIAPIMTWHVAGLLSKIQRLEQTQRQLASYDCLTGLLARRVVFEQLQHLITVSTSKQYEFCLAYIDIDNFKAINDSYGHSVGDEVLKHFATILQQHFRGADVTGRIGGEEFAVLLPQTNQQEAIERLNTLREKVQFTAASGAKFDINYTVSIGISHFSIGSNLALDKLVNLADGGLYQAKKLGRNRVEVLA